MKNLTYRREAFEAVIDELEPMLEEHFKEVGYHNGPTEVAVDDRTYTSLDDAGRMMMFTVRDDEDLVGYLSVVFITPTHHCNDIFACVDAFYVKKEYRRSSIGLKLFKKAEAAARNKGVKYMTAMSNINAPIENFLSGMGFELTDKTYIRILGE